MARELSEKMEEERLVSQLEMCGQQFRRATEAYNHQLSILEEYDKLLTESRGRFVRARHALQEFQQQFQEENLNQDQNLRQQDCQDTVQVMEEQQQIQKQNEQQDELTTQDAMNNIVNQVEQTRLKETKNQQPISETISEQNKNKQTNHNLRAGNSGNVETTTTIITTKKLRNSGKQLSCQQTTEQFNYNEEIVLYQSCEPQNEVEGNQRNQQQQGEQRQDENQRPEDIQVYNDDGGDVLRIVLQENSELFGKILQHYVTGREHGKQQVEGSTTVFGNIENITQSQLFKNIENTQMEQQLQYEDQNRRYTVTAMEVEADEKRVLERFYNKINNETQSSSDIL
eukprot:TRINITY_DN10722_c0_g1_i1.p1 TRINITY_DN10722_c0_g1~~TRINITY_DN10722_c0_g1_i1.p1  ORF type:complete len:342 (+),score=50.71 TRINITY_DN10722_c0_g1_i1:149-1174(+)